MNEWKKTRLGDVAEVFDGPHATPPPCEKAEAYFLGIPHITETGHIDLTDPRYIAEEDYAKWTRRVTPQFEDVVFSYEATLNRYAIIPQNLKCCLGRRMGLVRPNRDKLSPTFLYYYFFSTEWRDTVKVKTISGATVERLPIADFPNFEISLPPRPIQDRIAGILSEYDSAIANCRKQIALLEEAAMRLYREWFKDGKGEKKRLGDVIDFDPPMTLPKGIKRFSVPMSALQNSSMVLDKTEFEITTSNSGSKFKNGDTLLARITPCLENGKTAFVFGVDEEGACGSTEFIVMRSKRLNPYMVYLLARTESFRRVAIASMSGADGRQRARKEVIADYEILVPSPDAIEKLGKMHKPMFSQIEALANQIRMLTEARNRLLPKLMKGEIVRCDGAHAVGKIDAEGGVATHSGVATHKGGAV